MKIKVFVLLTIIGLGFLCSCNNDDIPESEVVGTWKLVAILDGPEDGNGSFENVRSNKIVQFHEDGFVTSNGKLNDNSTTANTPSSLRYSVNEGVIFTEGFASMKFEVDGKILIIVQTCPDGCQSKFVKVPVIF